MGYIGGKTQTEFAGMDDLYLDGKPCRYSEYFQMCSKEFVALGITDEDELLELKGTKKKRGKKIDDPDFLVSFLIIISVFWLSIFAANVKASRRERHS